VVRYKLGTNQGELVAGGNGDGSDLNQICYPAGIAVDGQSIVIADYENHRVVRWTTGAKEGVVIAGGNGMGNALNQLNNP